MKALVLTATDGPGATAVLDVDTPTPQAGEVRVKLKAASLNHRELWITRGQYFGMIATPFTMGCDGAGSIDAVGAGVDQGFIGKDVVLYPGLNWGPDLQFPAANFGTLGMPGPGTIAEWICVPAAHAIPKPSFLSFEEAAAIPLGALTAWRGLTTKAGLKAGEHIMITGIGGGVATFALKFAVAMGATAFVTSGSADTLARAQALGAKAGFNYKGPEWRKAVAQTTDGLHVVFDAAPASSYPNYSRALNMGARVVLYGSTGGQQFPVNVPEVFFKNVSIIGTNVGNLPEFEAALAFIEKHRIKPSIDQGFQLSAAKEALSYLESSHQFGKVVISI